MISPRLRPKIVASFTTKIQTSCGDIYITIGFDEQGIFEVITHFGKTGNCKASLLEAISRLISLAFQCDIEPEEIIRRVKGIRCNSNLSCVDAIVKTIQSCLQMLETPENFEGSNFSRVI